jgi:fermentation-respiration switch protein FrsA (DUF1100 family)
VTDVQKRSLDVSSDDLSLKLSIAIAERPRGAVVLMHGIPSINPSDPADKGYPGWAEEWAARGWIAATGDMRAARDAPGYFSIEGWVRDCAAMVAAARSLPEADGLPLALVGSSAGGCVSAVAVSRGAPVDALALLGAPAAWVSFAGDGWAGVKRITEEAGMAVAPEVAEDPTSWAAEFETVTTTDAIARVGVPTLIMHGSADDVVPVEHARLIAEQVPQAEVIILEGAPHVLRREVSATGPLYDWMERVLS